MIWINNNRADEQIVRFNCCRQQVSEEIIIICSINKGRVRETTVTQNPLHFAVKRRTQAYFGGAYYIIFLSLIVSLVNNRIKFREIINDH
jgi:hypothetical protein